MLNSLLLLMCRKMYSRDPLINAGNRQLALVLERVLDQLGVGERGLLGAEMRDKIGDYCEVEDGESIENGYTFINMTVWIKLKEKLNGLLFNSP